MSNRFSLVTSYYFNWDRDLEFIQNPNDERFPDNTLTNWNFKIFGTYGRLLSSWRPDRCDTSRAPRSHATSRCRGRRDRTSPLTGGGSYEAERPARIAATTSRSSTPSSSAASARDRDRSRGSWILQHPQHQLGEHQRPGDDRRPPTVTLADGSRVQVQGFLRPTTIVPPRIYCRHRRAPELLARAEEVPAEH